MTADKRPVFMRKFNVTGLFVPGKHYMVDISDKLAKIKEMVDNGDYFTINHARQYGKTTTLSLLRKMLRGEYIVASISFEGLGDKSFESDATFCRAFMELVQRALRFTDAPDGYGESWLNKDVVDFKGLGVHITEMCEDKKLVLMIDEVDRTGSNRVFLHFLAKLREKYLERADDVDHTFHSVILTGVYDIKNVKLKMINEGTYTPAAAENKIYNSPWNIAADFKVDMSFSPAGISTMLAEYESDHNAGMDITAIADEIYGFTNGYPFLVSRICQHIDEELDKDWTVFGVNAAVQIILEEVNTLFDDMFKNLENNRELYDFLYGLLFVGEESVFKLDNPVIALGNMYGFLKKGENNKTAVANRIFEKRIYEYFLSKDSTSKKRRSAAVLQRDVVIDDRFDMELCLRKFAEHYAELYSDLDAPFLEREGRLLFLSYLRPLINGRGFYHIESQFTDLRRMDVVVDFGRDQFIVELKLWKGEAEHNRAYEQLAGYMKSKGVSTAYLLTFDFRKNAEKQPRAKHAKWVDFDGKKIFDVIV